MKLTVAGVCAVVYPILLGGGALFVYLRSPQASGYQATVALPFNHLIAKGDLTTSNAEKLSNALQRASGAADVQGYTASAVQAGQIIRKDNLDSRPLIVPEPGTVAFSAEVDPARVASGEINAGVSVAVCDGDKIISNPFRVLAVVCFTGAARCTAVLETAAAGSDDIIALIEHAQPSQIKILAGVHGTPR